MDDIKILPLQVVNSRITADIVLTQQIAEWRDTEGE